MTDGWSVKVLGSALVTWWIDMAVTSVQGRVPRLAGLGLPAQTAVVAVMGALVVMGVIPGVLQLVRHSLSRRPPMTWPQRVASCRAQLGGVVLGATVSTLFREMN
ncbi:hypothetical protein [Burkholderia vietnamiensis]|uniref:hypothetical protein n=1 Tax=Burkholderia vietnamiensis TaxID=60552 RepID=UPI000753115C|nr:hypothetical protein [Burkholderia vietnamiensis]KVF65172.1 hypothetical protein WJ17_22455 [Burkholderia vietnamiensis]